MALISLVLGSGPAALADPSTTTSTPPGEPALTSSAPPETSTVPPSPGTSPTPGVAPPTPESLVALSAQAERDGDVRVAVRFRDGVDPDAAAATTLTGTEHVIGSESGDVVGVQVDADGLSRLAASPDVESIVEDIVLRPMSGTVHPDAHTSAVRADVLHDRGIDGTGRRIAILDSGFDFSHPALDEVAVVAEACFVTGSDDPCEAATGPGSAAPCDLTKPDCAHGTHVASIMAGAGSYDVPRGIAPGSELVAIRVLSPDDGAVVATATDIAAALDHVLALDAQHPIDAVNMSLGSEDYVSPVGVACDFEENGPLLAERFAQLRAAGIAPIVASGNSGEPSLAFPACITGAIPVGGWDSSTGRLWTDSNGDSRLKIAAPAVGLRGAIPSGSSASPVKSGTSLATPQVTAAVALMRQVDPDVPVAAIPFRMHTTGRPISGTTARRLDVAAAVGGYWVVDADGRVRAAGATTLQPIPPKPALAVGERVVAGAATPAGDGNWLVTNKGRVIANGGAAHKGDMTGQHLNKPIVAMANTPTGQGYWLLASDGGVFTFGDATFHGSTGNMRLNAPVTDMAAAPSGRGYWLTATDGGVFTFGQARFYGSTGNMTLNQPVVSIAAHPTAGYWLVARDGGVFAFGGARYHGSLPGEGIATTKGARVRATVGGLGYYITTLDGGIHSFGNAAPITPAGSSGPAPVVDVMVPAIN